MLDHLHRYLFVAIALLALCACGGGSSSPATYSLPAGTATPTPTPSPTASPAGGVALSQSSVAFDDTGQSALITAGEPAYSGPISVNAKNCSAVVAVTPSSATTSPATFTVTAQAAGACILTFTDQFGQSASLSIGVTVTKGTIQ
jgi:hypothetical protein